MAPNADSTDLLVAFPQSAVVKINSGGESVILKIAFDEVASSRLDAEAGALEQLAAMEELGSWRSMIATVVDHGKHECGDWFTQTVVTGATPTGDTAGFEEINDRAARAIAPLHALTAQQITQSEAREMLVNGPISIIQAHRPELGDALDSIADDLGSKIGVAGMTVSLVHGDYAPTNILLDESGEVSGIIDWSLDSQRQPPEIDLIHFALSLFAVKHDVEYGSAVLSMLGDPAARAAAEEMATAGPNSLSVELAVQLVWLQHVSIGLEKAEDLRRNPIWVQQNISQVVESIATVG